MPRPLNDVDAARIQGRSWTPAVLRPALWLDAADLSTITISTGVSEWRDKSGNNWHATQGASTNQPAFLRDALNGLSLVDFDGSNDALVVNAGLTSALSANNTYTTAFVVLPDAISGQPVLMHEPVASTFRFLNQIASNGGFFFGDTSANFLTYNFNIAAANTPSIIVATKSSATVGSLDANGLYRDPDSGTLAATPTMTNSIRIGDYSTGALRYNGKFGEIFVFTYALDRVQVSQLAGYLSWKWNIRLVAEDEFARRPPLNGG